MSGDTRRDALRRAGVAVTTLALVASIVVGALSGSRAIGDRLTPQARASLDAAGLVDVRVDLTGREAEVSGSTPRDLARAVQVVDTVEGVRWTRVARADRDLPTGAYVRLAQGRAGLHISGSMPGAGAAATIKGTAAETFATPVLGDLQVDPEVDSPEWVAQLPAALADLVAIRGLRLQVAGSSVAVGGSVASAAGRRKVLDRLTESLPGLTVRDDLRVAPGRLPSDAAGLLDAVTVRFDRGSADLRPEDVVVLDRVADLLRSHPDVTIEVGGLAAPGADGLEASRRRLVVVRTHLVEAGVEARRVSVKSYASAPADVADDAETYRRVDLVVKES